MTDVNGRAVVVTGAASGLGRLLALGLAGRGARVALWDLDPGDLEPVVKEIRAANGEAVGYACDVGDPAGVRETAAKVETDVGSVDVLVNNAGVVSGRGFLELTDEDVERTFRVNTLAHFWTTRAFLPRMLERGSGHLVTVSSAAGFVGAPRQVDYAASKHATVGFHETLRVELAGLAPSIRTTLVCPFYVDTGMFAGVGTRFPRLLPILRPEAVSDRVLRAIERDQARVLMPPTVYLATLGNALPEWLRDRLRATLGVDDTMDHFTGRGAG